MKPLLHTVLRRYFRSKFTLLILLAMPLLGGLSGLIVFESRSGKEILFYAEICLYFLIASLFLLTAGIILTIGNDFADGIIRLQCIHANTKTQISLSHIFGAMLWSTLCGTLMMIPFCFFGMDFFALYLTGKVMQVIPPLLMMYTVWGTLTAVLTLSIRNRAFSAIMGIALLLGMLIGSMQLFMRLDEPKYRTEMVYDYTSDDTDGQAQPEEKLVRNEWYIDKPKRDYLEFAYMTDPITPIAEEFSFLTNVQDNYQSADSFNKEIRSIHRARRKFLPWFQCFELLALTAAGTWLFQRRNLS